MFEKFANLFQKNKDSIDTQAASEATVLLLTLLYRVDKKIKLQEQDFLASALPSLKWSSPIHIDIFQADAIRKVDAAIKNNQVKEFVETHCANINFKGDLLKLLNELASADGSIDQDEQNIINTVKSALA